MMICKRVFYAALLAAAGLNAFEIQLPESASQEERNAAALLRKYAGQIAPDSKTVFQLKSDPGLPPESWKISGDGKIVTLTGGRKGLYLAVAHYLQDICGAMFYSPFEREYPRRELPADFAVRSGRPAFSLRMIHGIYGRDGGEFAVLRGLNGDGSETIQPRFGGSKLFGPPYFVHTMAMYIPVSKYYKTHPEWFAQRKGKRLSNTGSGVVGGQLCLSNTELRKEVLKRLREYIARGVKQAKASGMEPPRFYDLSQNDNQLYCQCPQCQELAKKYGDSQAGVLLDFINEIAREIRKDHPEVMITTLVYQYTEKPPVGIKPENNVTMVLCDTLSNVIEPIESQRNPYFRKRVKEWSELTRNLRIWDYKITYQAPREIPYNSEWTYQNDQKFFRDNGVTQLFCEMEEPVREDVRDYKIYLQTALMENPDADVDALSRKFAKHFYGPAADLFLQYRRLLKESQQKKGTYLGMYPNVNSFTHLDFATVTAAQKLFDEGEILLKNDPVRLRRWNHARLSLDRATLILTRNLMREYLLLNNSLDGYPFQVDRIAARISTTTEEQAKLRLTEQDAKKFLAKQRAETAKYSLPVNPRSLAVPERFRNLPKERLFDFTMESASRWQNIVKLVDDPDSDTGKVACLAFPNQAKGVTVEKYQFPLLFGIYSPELKKNLWGYQFQKKQVKSPGWNWYKLGTTTLSADCLMFFFFSWNIQLGISNPFDLNHPDQKFDIWMKMKFTGPAYPHGKADEKNAIWIERVMLVEHQPLRKAVEGDLAVQINHAASYAAALRSSGKWDFEYRRQFGKKEQAPWQNELGAGNDKYWRINPKAPWICGYSGNIVLRFDLPDMAADMVAEASVVNYADRKTRKYLLQLSYDGKNYQTFHTQSFSAGEGKCSVQTKLAPEKTVWFRLVRLPADKNDTVVASFGAVVKEISIRFRSKTDDK